MIARLLFRSDQNAFFKSQTEDNREEIKIWYIINVIIPCIIILIPAFFYSFLPADRVNIQNLVLNGSFSLLGINILYSMSIFLINSIRLKDVKIERDIFQLRMRLLIYLIVFLIVGTIIYLLQIAFNLDTLPRISTSIISFILILYFSIGIGKRIYLIKDELVGKSFGDEIRDNVKDLKNSTDDLE